MTSRTSPRKSLCKVHERNMKLIEEKCCNNLEMQVLVLSYLDDLEASKNKVPEPPKGNKNKKHQDAFDEDDSPETTEIYIDPKAMLHRNNYKYSVWKKALFWELFQYCDPKRWTSARKSIDSVQLFKQCMEFGFDINCTDGKSDKAASLNKLEVFTSLKALYKASGSRFQKVDVVDGFIDWQQCGCFSIQDQRSAEDGRSVIVTDRISGKSACVPTEFLKDHPAYKFSNKDITMNYSWKEAEMYIPGGDVLTLSQLFPKITRVLKKKLSDQLGATSPEGAAGRPASKQSASEDSGGSKKALGKRKVQKHLGMHIRGSASDHIGVPGHGNNEDQAKRSRLAAAVGDEDDQHAGGDDGEVPSPTAGEAEDVGEKLAHPGLTKAVRNARVLAAGVRGSLITMHEEDAARVELEMSAGPGAVGKEEDA